MRDGGGMLSGYMEAIVLLILYGDSLASPELVKCLHTLELYSGSGVSGIKGSILPTSIHVW